MVKPPAFRTPNSIRRFLLLLLSGQDGGDFLRRILSRAHRFLRQTRESTRLARRFGSSVTFNSLTGNFENLRAIRSTASGIKLPMPSSRYIFGTFGLTDKDPLVRQWPRSRILTITGYILWRKRKRPWGVGIGCEVRSELKSGLAGKGWLRQGDLNLELVTCRRH